MKALSMILAAMLAALVWATACSSTGDAAPPGDDAAAPPAIPRPDTSDPIVLRGWTSVLQRGCPTCHQSPDASDGILSGRIEPVSGTSAYAPNLTPDPDTGLDGWSADAIVRAIRQGLDAEGAKLCTTMPRFSDMRDDEAAAIARYLLFLTAAHHAIPESLCPPIKVPGGETDSGDDGSTDAAEADGGASDAANDALDAADG